MAYKIQLEDLRSLVEYLKQIYKNTNPQRLSYIACLEETVRTTAGMDDFDAQKVLLGAAIFELEYINSKYPRLSPLRSTLFSGMLNKLKLKYQDFNYQENIYYVLKYKKFIEKHWSEINFENMKLNLDKINKERKCNVRIRWGNKKDLLDSLDYTFIHMINRNRDALTRLENGPAELLALRRNIRELPQKYYDAIKGKWFKDPSRKVLLNIMKLIDETSSQLYQGAVGNQILEESEEHALNGALLWILLHINNSYNVLSPKGGILTEGSKLFQIILKMLGAKNLESIDPKKQLDWMNGLTKHLKLLKSHTDYYKFKKKEWEDQGLGDLDTMIDQMQKLLDVEVSKCEIAKNQPSTSYAVMSAATGTAAYYGITFAYDSGMLSTAAIGLAGLIGLPIAPAGFLIGGGVLLMFKVLSAGVKVVVKTDLVSEALGSFGAWLLDHTTQKAGAMIVNALGFNTNATTKENFAILRKALSPEDERIFCRWVNSVMEMPRHIVPDEEKELIKRVFVFDVKNKIRSLHGKESRPPKKTHEHNHSNAQPGIWTTQSVNFVVDYDPHANDFVGAKRL